MEGGPKSGVRRQAEADGRGAGLGRKQEGQPRLEEEGLAEAGSRGAGGSPCDVGDSSLSGPADSDAGAGPWPAGQGAWGGGWRGVLRGAARATSESRGRARAGLVAVTLRAAGRGQKANDAFTRTREREDV